MRLLLKFLDGEKVKLVSLSPVFVVEEDDVVECLSQMVLRSECEHLFYKSMLDYTKDSGDEELLLKQARLLIGDENETDVKYLHNVINKRRIEYKALYQDILSCSYDIQEESLSDLESILSDALEDSRLGYGRS